MSKFRNERDRLAYEAWKRQDEEEQERPIKQAAAQLSRTAGALIEVQRKNLLEIRDPDFYVTPGLERTTMELEAAQQFNGIEAKAFVQANPDYFPSERNFSLLIDYFERNDCTIIDCAMWKAAIDRFRAVGLLDERPVPEPEPIVEVEPEPDLDSLPRLPLSYTRPSGWKRESEGSQIGHDPLTGREREYTDVEIDRMSGDEYRAAFRLSIPALTKANFQR